jgi:hypothetical protein
MASDQTRSAAIKQRAIIIPPGKNADHFGEGVYTLVAEDGECLASHFCSHAGFAPGDLYEHRPERFPMFEAKGITGWVWLGDSGITLEELLKRNAEFAGEGAVEAG